MEQNEKEIIEENFKIKIILSQKLKQVFIVTVDYNNFICLGNYFF
jgi:hypothetical protein